MHPCFGITALGMCAYDPAHPGVVYFSIGNATAALAFTFAIQQFIKPIYRFRLAAYGIRLWVLFALVLAGFACAVVAATLSNFSFDHTSPFSYPIFWELLGVFLIGAAYTVSGFIALVPARIYQINFYDFIRAGARLLSSADDEAMADFAEDLLGADHNLTTLQTFASALDAAEHAESRFEFERLEEIGAPLTISGQPPINAFYRFTHRVELRRAKYAAAFLRVLSDAHFCSVLVRKCPWITAISMNRLAERHIAGGHVADFVQQIAAQALIQDTSLLAKEISYDGFAAAPILSESLFTNWRFLRSYEPLAKFRFGGVVATEGFVKRLNGASELMMRCALRNGDYWSSYYMRDACTAYQTLYRQVSYLSEKEINLGVLISLQFGLQHVYQPLIEALESADERTLKSLFAKAQDSYRDDLVRSVAKVLYESMASYANSFTGPDDRQWSHAIQLAMDVFPFHKDVHAGMNPLQQQLAVLFIRKLRDNMDGWYPAISRVLLATLGPYERNATDNMDSAYGILKRAMYLELQRLPDLYDRKAGNIAPWLPANVTYDRASNSLIHRYTGGTTGVTQLGSLTIGATNLFDEKLRHPSTGQDTGIVIGD